MAIVLEAFNNNNNNNNSMNNNEDHLLNGNPVDPIRDREECPMSTDAHTQEHVRQFLNCDYHDRLKENDINKLLDRLTPKVHHDGSPINQKVVGEVQAEADQRNLNLQDEILAPSSNKTPANPFDN